MRVSLIDIDSRIPNIALMKLSTWHKERGDEIIFNFPLMQYSSDRVYASVIFRKNLPRAESMLCRKAEIGGSGSDNWNILPDEVEVLMPDYSLYNCDYSLGFTTRGCIRRCEFCIVPQKEGAIREVADIYQFWNPQHKKIVFLDNNILALKPHFFRICEQVKKENLAVDFNQGLDFRFLDAKVCEALKSIRIKHIRFAFDNISDAPAVEEAIDLLDYYGLHYNFWYVLIGFNTSIEEDFQRLELLKRRKQRPFAMKYRSTPELTKLARWVNQHGLFAVMTFEEFCERDKRKIA